MHFLYILLTLSLLIVSGICIRLHRNITALKRKVQLSNSLAKARGVFVNMTAHDFRNHLTTIQMSADMLSYNSSHLSPETKQSIVNNINCGVKKLANMINDLMLLGKLQYNQIEFSPKSINIIQACHEIIVEHDEYFSRTELSVNGDMPDIINIDITLLRHILSNLLSNALKYSTKTVTLQISIDKNFIVLEVIDQGIGIPEKDIHAIANIFERCTNAKTFTGTGLGMYIVSQCVNLHHGKMYIKSVINHGTTVMIKLPYT